MHVGLYRKLRMILKILFVLFTFTSLFTFKTISYLHLCLNYHSDGYDFSIKVMI